MTAAVASMDIIPVTGITCPICLKEFDNGNEIVVFSCGGGHLFCKGCYEDYAAFDRQTVADCLSEAVRRAEGADKCPSCRQLSHCATIGIAQRFYPGSGRTEEDPVTILDDDVADTDGDERLTHEWNETQSDYFDRDDILDDPMPDDENDSDYETE